MALYSREQVEFAIKRRFWDEAAAELLSMTRTDFVSTCDSRTSMCNPGWEQAGTSFGETGAAFTLTCPSFTRTIAIRMCVGHGHAFPAGALDTE